MGHFVSWDNCMVGKGSGRVTNKLCLFPYFWYQKWQYFPFIDLSKVERLGTWFYKLKLH